MPERPNGTVSKTVVGLCPPWVQIPPLPPLRLGRARIPLVPVGTVQGVVSRLSEEIRASILRFSHHANKGHIGSALSICELLAAVTEEHSRVDDHSRPYIVMSKGHAAVAYYSLVKCLSWAGGDDTETYGSDGTAFGTHPDHLQEASPFTTGSLGQGITFAVGVALARKMRGDTNRVTCILSDSELNEGSTWEAIMLAGQLRLSSLTVILDANGQQAMGRTSDILDASSLVEAIGNAGHHVAAVDGHSVPDLCAELGRARARNSPTFIVARTTAGKGVSFMEGRIEWHYLPMTREQFDTATSEVTARQARLGEPTTRGDR